MAALIHPDAGQLTAYAQGTLPPAQAKQVEAHLAGCQHCRSQVAALRSRTAHPGTLAAPTVDHVADPSNLVAGHEIVREVMRSGMGVIYLARHPVLNDFRAIKRPVVRDGVDRDALLARFRREVRAIGALRHDHIIRAHDAGADAEGPFLVMEFIDGESLTQLVSRQGRLGVPQACEMIRQAALGLQAGHERGLVHRDVKPSNLMLARAGTGARVVVIDWGLVKWSAERPTADLGEESTRYGVAMGTPDFMPPEQYEDSAAVDIRADVYSLGATLYFLLAGHAPFQDRTGRAKRDAHMKEPFPPLNRPGIPQPLLDALARMAEKLPARRFAKPGDVAEALQPFCAGSDPRRLLALLDPSAAPSAPPLVFSDTRDGSARETKPSPSRVPAAAGPPTAMTIPPHAAPTRIATPPPVPPAAPNQAARTRPKWLIPAGTIAVIAAVVVLVVVMTRGGSGDSAKSDPPGDGRPAEDREKGGDPPPPKGGETPPGPVTAPRILVDEDFSTALAAAKPLPDGWSGEAMRVANDPTTKRPALEVTKPTGDHFATLQPLPLDRDFFVEGVCGLGHPLNPRGQYVAVVFESSKTKARLPVFVHWTGAVAIADDPRQPQSSFVQGSGPVRFQMAREGRTLTVWVNKEVAAVKELTHPDHVGEFDTLRVGLPGEPALGNFLAKLFHLKVVAGATRAPAVPTPPAGGKLQIDENFASSRELSCALPPGWTGEAFRLVMDPRERRACAEVSKPAGDHFATLPPVSLKDYSVEAEYALGYPLGKAHKFIVSFESSATKARFPLAVDWQGAVTIGDDDKRTPPAREYVGKIIRFRAERKGTTLTVWLNKEVVATKELKTPAELAEFDTVRLGLPGEPGLGPFLAKLYSVKVGTPGG